MSKSILELAVEKEANRKAYRETYNAQPKVKERRTLYNKKRNGELAVAAKFVAAKITKEEAEGMIELLGREYLDGVAALDGKTNIARSAKHTNNS